jgi:hypothetical protein
MILSLKSVLCIASRLQTWLDICINLLCKSWYRGRNVPLTRYVREIIFRIVHYSVVSAKIERTQMRSAYLLFVLSHNSFSPSARRLRSLLRQKSLNFSTLHRGHSRFRLCSKTDSHKQGFIYNWSARFSKKERKKAVATMRRTSR